MIKEFEFNLEELTDPVEQKDYVLARVMNHMGWKREKAILWYKTANPHLGGASPCHMVLIGRFEKLLKFIEACELDNG